MSKIILKCISLEIYVATKIGTKQILFNHTPKFSLPIILLVVVHCKIVSELNAVETMKIFKSKEIKLYEIKSFLCSSLLCRSLQTRWKRYRRRNHSCPSHKLFSTKDKNGKVNGNVNSIILVFWFYLSHLRLQTQTHTTQHMRIIPLCCVKVSKSAGKCVSIESICVHFRSSLHYKQIS